MAVKAGKDIKYYAIQPTLRNHLFYLWILPSEGLGIPWLMFFSLSLQLSCVSYFFHANFQ